MKRFLGIIIVMAGLMGCSASKPVEDPRISQTYEEGYHKLIVEYGTGISNVRLQGVALESSEPYYVEDGIYSLTYEYHLKVSIGMEISYNREDRGSDNDSMEQYRNRRIQEDILIDRDIIMELTDKKFEVNITGEAGS